MNKQLNMLDQIKANQKLLNNEISDLSTFIYDDPKFYNLNQKLRSLLIIRKTILEQQQEINTQILYSASNYKLTKLTIRLKSKWTIKKQLWVMGLIHLLFIVFAFIYAIHTIQTLNSI